MQIVINKLYNYHDALRIQFKGSLEAPNNVKIINMGANEVMSNFLLEDWSFLNEDSFKQKVIEDISKIEAENRFDNNHLASFRIYRSKNGDHFYMMIMLVL